MSFGFGNKLGARSVFSKMKATKNTKNLLNVNSHTLLHLNIYLSSKIDKNETSAISSIHTGFFIVGLFF